MRQFKHPERKFQFFLPSPVGDLQFACQMGKPITQFCFLVGEFFLRDGTVQTKVHQLVVLFSDERCLSREFADPVLRGLLFFLAASPKHTSGPLLDFGTAHLEAVEESKQLGVDFLFVDPDVRVVLDATVGRTPVVKIFVFTKPGFLRLEFSGNEVLAMATPNQLARKNHHVLATLLVPQSLLYAVKGRAIHQGLMSSWVPLAAIPYFPDVRSVT